MTIGNSTTAGTAGSRVGARHVWLARLRRLDLPAAVDLAAFFVAAPLLVFPNRFSPVALALLPAVWLGRVVLRRHALRRTAAEWPLAGLLLMLSVSLYPSVDLSLSRPKLLGLILGIFLFTLLVQHLTTPARRAVLAAALVLGGVGVAGVGFVGTDWLAMKLPVLGPFYARLPRLITSVQDSLGNVERGFQPNEVGGALALLLPFALGLLLFTDGRRLRLTLGAGSAAMLLTLGLTVSRSAWIGLAGAVVVLAVLRWRRLALALPAVALALAGLVFWLGPSRVAGWLLALETATGATGESRLEVWGRAWYMIQDFPFTGVGLNTFQVVANLLYPLFLLAPDAPIKHAHNLYLQVGVDFGVLGLLSFLGLLVVAAIGLARAWRPARGWERGMVAGLTAGLIGHLVYGLTDAVTLGAKPGLFLWAMLGAAIAVGSRGAACCARRQQAVGSGQAPRKDLDSLPTAHCSLLTRSPTAHSHLPARRGGALPWCLWALFTLACGLGAFISISGIKMLP